MPRGAPGDRAYRTLLLHGLADSSGVWTHVVGRFPPEHRVVAPDLPWSGAAIGGYAASYTRPTDAIATALAGPDGTADVVVAHSFSANLLLALLDAELRAGGRPLRRYGIRRMVLVSPFYRRRPEDFGWAAMAYFMNDFHRIMEEGLRAAALGRIPDDVLLDMAYRVRERVGPYGWTSFFDTYLRTPWLAVGELDVPCLVISGGDDIAADPSEAAALAADLPHAHLELVPGCGHFPMVSAPETFAGAVSGFLGDLHPVVRPELETHT